jgi:RNA polymerase sigma-70 factor (ECF subfamily)
MATDGLGNSSETNRLLGATGGGQAGAWDALLGKSRERLRRMVSLRLDHRLRGWVDPSDVIRQAFAEAAARRAEYPGERDEPFFLWLRRLSGQKLDAIVQQRLGERPPEAGRELSLRAGAGPPTNSLALAAVLLGQAPALSRAELRQQRMAQLETALNNMAPLEREVLALRHFERLSNAETAAVLAVEEAEASKLYVRALRTLKGILAGLDGPAGDTRP